jgi:hypothetical protein|tara:strand:+ start:193 stop:492 length:300 start_codon:yes stop_codon:yes gene_type:complete
MGLWGFLDVSSLTSLIPSLFGVLIFSCFLLSNKDKKFKLIFSHVAIALTLLILFALIGTRLPKSIEDGGFGLLRLLIMIGTSLLSIFIFIKSFLDARKN